MPRWRLHTEFTFEAAHSLPNYDGPCRRLHGHTYRVRITAESDRLYPSRYLSTPDMVCDFRELRWARADQEAGGLDHAYLNDILEAPPTAERIAEYIHRETKKRLPEGIKLTVTVWETPTSWCEYTDED
jgi:6-pyruvoyltetrahydropterin/6-carboxytetrahydropterin synthase|nr:MAG: 6-carboxy-5,6,7,8-tetrahydropterin synthase [Bacteroidota bacterium]